MKPTSDGALGPRVAAAGALLGAIGILLAALDGGRSAVWLFFALLIVLGATVFAVVTFRPRR